METFKSMHKRASCMQNIRRWESEALPPFKLKKQKWVKICIVCSLHIKSCRLSILNWGIIAWFPHTRRNVAYEMISDGDMKSKHFYFMHFIFLIPRRLLMALCSMLFYMLCVSCDCVFVCMLFFLYSFFYCERRRANSHFIWCWQKCAVAYVVEPWNEYTFPTWYEHLNQKL